MTTKEFHMFLAEIVAVHVDENLVGKDGHIGLNKAGLIAFMHSEYYELNSKCLGRFGYSVMKSKTAKRRRGEDKPTGGNKPHWNKGK